jgi:hypothetical protein
MVEQLALNFGFASREGCYSIGGILSWSLHAMTEVPAGDRRPHRMPSWSEIRENLDLQSPSE